MARDLAGPIEHAREEDTNPRLAARAVSAALEMAGLPAAQLGYLIGNTTSPHTRLPPSVSWAADEHRYGGPYMELRQACTGFANALQVADGFPRGDDAPPVAIAGSETGSLQFAFTPAFVDREQVVNCVQMCDGAGAVVLGPGAGRDRGVIEAIWFRARGQGRAPGFWMGGSPSSAAPVPIRHAYRAVRSRGPELFEAGVATVAELGFEIQDFDFVLPHQANGRMARLITEGFGIDASRVIAGIGNLGSACICVSFDRLRRSGRMQSGQPLLVLGAEATKYMFGGFVYRH